MTYSIEFSETADKSISKFKKSNPILFKKLVEIILDISQHPRIGKGHPEALRCGSGITYSRMISAQHRIIYDVYDDKVCVLILTVEGYYGDK